MQPSILVSVLYSATMICRRGSSFSSALLLSVLPDRDFACSVSLASGFLFCPERQELCRVQWGAKPVHTGLGALRGQFCAWLWNVLHSDNHIRTFPFSSLLNKNFSLLLVSGSLWQTTVFYLWFYAGSDLGRSLLLCGSSNQISICSVGKCIRHKRHFLYMWTEMCCFPLFLKPLARFFSLSKLECFPYTVCVYVLIEFIFLVAINYISVCLAPLSNDKHCFTLV